MVNCTVKVKCLDGSRIRYAGLFASTCDAVLDAIEKFGVGVQVTARVAA